MDAERGERRKANIERRDGGSFAVRGPMTFDSASELWSESRELFTGGEVLRIDLSEVTHTDSAGLALLVEWLREAAQRGARLELSNLPAQLVAIAGASNLERLLGVKQEAVTP